MAQWLFTQDRHAVNMVEKDVVRRRNKSKVSVDERFQIMQDVRSGRPGQSGGSESDRNTSTK